MSEQYDVPDTDWEEYDNYYNKPTEEYSNPETEKIVDTFLGQLLTGENND